MFYVYKKYDIEDKELLFKYINNSNIENLFEDYNFNSSNEFYNVIDEN